MIHPRAGPRSETRRTKNTYKYAMQTLRLYHVRDGRDIEWSFVTQGYSVSWADAEVGNTA